MKSVIILLVGLSCVLAQDQYNEKYDNFNIKEVLDNERLLQGYANCFLDKGPCTPNMLEIKEKIPEVLNSKCAKCSEKQKSLLRELSTEVKQTHPKLFEDLKKKYDPDQKHEKAFKELANKKN